MHDLSGEQLDFPQLIRMKILCTLFKNVFLLLCFVIVACFTRPFLK